MQDREYLLYAVLVVGALLSPSVYAQWKRGVATPTASLVEVSYPARPDRLPPDAFTILLVPGHDVATGGALFSIYERDPGSCRPYRTATEGDDGFKTIITRSTTSWSDTFYSFFTGQEQEIFA
jgi:hypothetical protein